MCYLFLQGFFCFIEFGFAFGFAKALLISMEKPIMLDIYTDMDWVTYYEQRYAT